MEYQIPEAKNIKAENTDGTQFSAEINGQRWSGITEGSRFMASVQKAIEAGEPVEPYAPPTGHTYADLRREAYAPIGEQLDMQYHDAKDGTTTWIEHVESVKAQFPKE